MSTRSEAQRPSSPGLWWCLTEPTRAVVDFGQLAAARSVLRMAPRGDGHAVLVLPGLLASDVSTVPLRRFLRGLDYRVRGWRLGRNIGPTRATLAGLRALLDDTADRHGAPVSLIGWSLGGIYARELAREHPDLVRAVITLGSPYRLTEPRQTYAHRVFDWLSPLHAPSDELPPPEHTRPAFPVPATSVYSRSDGIVHWQACVEPPGPRQENVEVASSHLGYGHNAAVQWLVADRLAQPADAWCPFEPPVALSRHYPAQATRSRSESSIPRASTSISAEAS
jgi:pimeloyl-ACP methyl ester carboxylesterase